MSIPVMTRTNDAIMKMTMMTAIALRTTTSAPDDVVGDGIAPEPVSALGDASADEVSGADVAVAVADATGGAALSGGPGGAIGAAIAGTTSSESKSN